MFRMIISVSTARIEIGFKSEAGVTLDLGPQIFLKNIQRYEQQISCLYLAVKTEDTIMKLNPEGTHFFTHPLCLQRPKITTKSVIVSYTTIITQKAKPILENTTQ